MDGKIRIAVLDDIESHAKAARNTLESLGYEVRTACRLLDFEKLVKEFDPQIILLDVNMPDAPGDVVCKALKKDLATATTPIFLYSGHEEEELAREAERAGADGYICKTWGPDALRDRIAALTSEVLF